MNTRHCFKVSNFFSQSGRRTLTERKVGKLKGTAAVLSGLLLIVPAAQAGPPYAPDFVTGGNKWSFRAYDDASADHTLLVVAQGVCFEYAGTSGNHQLYTWYSDSFPGWSGRAVQEGDQLFMHGDFADGAGHSAIQIETLVAPTIYGSAGTWQEWRHDGGNGATVVFAKTRALREGNCTLTAEQAAALPPLLNGSPVTTDVAP